MTFKSYAFTFGYVAVLWTTLLCAENDEQQNSPESQPIADIDPANLEKMLVSDSYKDRSSAIGVVRRIGPQYIENLLVILIKTPDCEKRYSVYEALIQTRGSMSYQEELSHIIRHTRSAEIRELATLLRNAPHLLSKEHYNQPIAKDLRLNALNSGFESVRWLGIRLLSYYELEILTDWSLHSKNPDINSRILVIHEALRRRINEDPSWVIREAALDAFYWYGSNSMGRSQAIELVAILWDSPEWRGRHGWRLRLFLASLTHQQRDEEQFQEMK